MTLKRELKVCLDMVNMRLTAPGLSAPTKRRLNSLKLALQTALEQPL